MTRASSCSARASSRSTPSMRAVRDASAARCSRASDSRSTAVRNAWSASVRSAWAARNDCSASASPRARGGAIVRRLQHLPVEPVEQLAGRLPRLQPLVPAVLATVALAHQRAQAGGGELARELLGLLRQRLVLLGHLGLLLERFELPAELRQHVLQAQEILVEPRELALRALLAPAMLRDARRPPRCTCGAPPDAPAAPPPAGPGRRRCGARGRSRSPTGAPGRPAGARPGR